MHDSAKRKEKTLFEPEKSLKKCRTTILWKVLDLH